MTYSNTEIRSPSAATSNLAHTHAAYIAAVSPTIQAVIAQLLLWLAGAGGISAKSSRSSRAAYAAKVTAVISAIAAIMVCLPGSYQQKKALLESHFAKVTAKLDHLRAAYMIWRQRMCWMWGGGFISPSLAGLPGVFMAACDQKSFDALIPN